MKKTTNIAIPLHLHENLTEISRQTGVRIQKLTEVALASFLKYCDTPSKVLEFMRKAKAHELDI